IEGGELRAPDAPGLGVSLPDDVAERFTWTPGDTYAEVFPDHEKGRSL
ncbi:MAG: mandelate racemase/muconate lactonizing enzyme family protein, partial [Ilumatobacteraceae bacterium]|nr:mandelate racemase/muconate lactonizing enzyme family protein [Ilumatobacteraceae bacterium]